MNNTPEKAKGYDPGLERSRAQDRKKAKGYDPGLERSRAQNPHLISKFRLFLRQNKFARLVANIVISLAWLLISYAISIGGLLIYALWSFGKNCRVTFFGTFCRKISEVSSIWDWALPTILILFTFVPPLWLTWYLWIRKRVPKKK